MQRNEPTTLEGALVIIEELQRKLRCYESEQMSENDCPPGMRPQSWRLYKFLKAKGFASKATIAEFLWGRYPKHGNNISVAMSHIRDFLPAGEEIVGIRKSGYVWRKVDLTVPQPKPIIVLATQKDWREYASKHGLEHFDKRYVVVSNMANFHKIRGLEFAQLFHISPVPPKLKMLASAMVRP